MKYLNISQRKQYSKTEILKWSKSNTWIKLEVLNSSDKIVEFKAYYLDEKLNATIHHEKSTFKKEGTVWFYVDGDLKSQAKVGRNDPCPCGSGKKYKRCCA